MLRYDTIIIKSLYLFVPGILIIGITMFVIINSINIQEKKILQNFEKSIINLKTRNLDTDIETIINDLMILCNDNRVKKLWNSKEKSKIQKNLETYFLNISKFKKKYDQIRLLNKTGQEIVRVNYNNAKPNIAKKEQLQNKKNRYYFKDAFKLDNNNIFISPFDLNIEHKKIEQPLKPMLRIATPVFDENGKKQGIILINYLGKYIIDIIKKYEDLTSKNQLMLLNAEGYYLKGINKDEEWGFMYKNREELTFENKYNTAWLKIKKNKAGQFETKEGLFTFRTIYPLKKQEKTIGSTQIANDIKSYYWIIVSFIPHNKLYAKHNNRILISVFLFIVLSALLLFVVVKLLKARAYRLISKKEIIKKNNELIVSENKLKQRNKQLIIEKEKAEENEQKFIKTFQNSPNAFSLANLENGKIIEINDSFTRISGFTKDNVIGKTSNDLNLWINNEDRANAFAKLRKEGFIRNMEMQFRTKTGNIIDIIMASSIIKSNNSLIMASEFIDISDRKKAEQDLKKEHARFKKIMDINPSGIYIVDKKYNIEYTNPVIKKEFGQINDRKCYLYFHNLTKPCEWCKNKEVFAGKSVRWEWLLKKNNKYYDIFDTPITNPDGTISKFEIFFDITDSKKAEQALKESEEKLRKSNQTKDKFFSIIGHDLKSPFNAILGFSEILLKKHKDYDNEKREKLIKSVNDSANSAFKLLENLLTWSRSQSGVIKYSPEKLNLKILLFETLFDLQGQADKKNINVLDDISENELVFADKNMLATVLRNLISNAIKFTNNGGNIIISSKKQTDSNFVEISVEDTGVGIPKDTIDRLFRIDKNTSTQGTENEAGTGLGLILCKEFVEKHGGKIWAESEIGKGSEFIFSIPCSSDSLSNI